MPCGVRFICKALWGELSFLHADCAWRIADLMASDFVPPHVCAHSAVCDQLLLLGGHNAGADSKGGRVMIELN